MLSNKIEVFEIFSSVLKKFVENEIKYNKLNKQSNS